MLKVGDKITVHFMDVMHEQFKEFKTNDAGIVHAVENNNNQLGIYWNTSNGREFMAFKNFSWSVIFRNVNTGKLYRYCNTCKQLENVTVLNNKITWL